jgi:predicted deacetylase
MSGAGDRPLACVVVHDVADATLAGCERVREAIAEVAPVPITWLAVPRYHDATPTAALERWLGERSHAGDELALHGWTHRDDGTPRGPVDRLRREVYTRGEGEFWAIDADEAARRIAAGRAWFDANGWPLAGFVAPAWLLGPGAWQAVRAQPLQYTATLRHLHLLPEGRRLTSQSIVYSTSSAGRRASSVVWARVVEARVRRNSLLRLELHPRDADHAGVRRSWQRILATALREREALTVAQACAGLRARGEFRKDDARSPDASAGTETADPTTG